jgi:selenocysteine lyase/cysteine desulfurase
VGIRQPIEEIAALCRERNILFLLDAAQSAGHIAIDLEETPIDLMALPGHKGLLGPQGTGALYVRPGLEIQPLKFGGTGSESFSLTQPTLLPDRLESGTLNVPGICGLNAGIRYVQRHFSEIAEHELKLTNQLSEGLRRISGVTVYSPPEAESNVVLFNIPPFDSVDVADMLDRDYGIASRGGYHCAPFAHRALGTQNSGAVRLSIGHANTSDEIAECVQAVQETLHRLE